VRHPFSFGVALMKKAASFSHIHVLTIN